MRLLTYRFMALISRIIDIKFPLRAWFTKPTVLFLNIGTTLSLLCAHKGVFKSAARLMIQGPEYAFY